MRSAEGSVAMDGIGKSRATEELIANVLETRFENFDQATLENAKARIIDVIGCLIAGANAPGNPGLLNLVKGWGGRKEATILIHGSKLPAHNAAMVNSIMARSFDFEPVGPIIDNVLVPTHIGGTTVTTAITMGEMKNVSGREVLDRRAGQVKQSGVVNLRKFGPIRRRKQEIKHRENLG